MIDDQVLQRKIEQLPPLPQALWQALSVLRRDDSSSDACAAPIVNEPALAARVLRLANSAFYRLPGRVATVRDAVHVLGRRALSALLTTAAVTRQFAVVKCPGFEPAAFWRHAIASALAAEELASAMNGDADVAFNAALLHDIGRLALAAHYPAELAAALGLARADDVPPLAAERSLLGTDHAAIGALIAAHWRFPQEVVDAIAGHHAPPGTESTRLADLVHAADALAHALDLNADPGEAVPELDAGAWQRLALQPPQVLRAFDRSERGVTALCQALGL